METADIGVAMGNSREIVKEKADYVTGSNDEGGIWSAVEKFNFQSRN